MKRHLPLAARVLCTIACGDAGAETTATATGAVTSCSADFESALTSATAGLTWPSESDAPIEILVEPGKGTTPPTAPEVRALFGVPEGAPIEERALSDLDGIASPDLDTADPDGTTPYAALRRALEQELTDVRFFSFGEVQVGVYIVGRTRCGELAGIHATATET